LRRWGASVGRGRLVARDSPLFQKLATWASRPNLKPWQWQLAVGNWHSRAKKACRSHPGGGGGVKRHDDPNLARPSCIASHTVRDGASKLVKENRIAGEGGRRRRSSSTP